jgi:hypothetical protein
LKSTRFVTLSAAVSDSSADKSTTPAEAGPSSCCASSCVSSSVEVEERILLAGRAAAAVHW